MKYVVYSCMMTVFVIVSATKVFASHDEMVRELYNTSLSREEVDAYLTGKPFGLDKVAELNDYPSPEIVLNMRTILRLSVPQFNRTRMLHKKLRKYTRLKGRQIVRKEEELDKLFRENSIDSISLQKLVKDIALLKGELRLIHLKTRVAQREFLSDHQLYIYARQVEVDNQPMFASDE